MLLIGLAAVSAAALEITVTRLDGTRVEARLISLGSVIKAEAKAGALVFNWDEIADVEFHVSGDAPATQPSPPLRITLIDGARFAATPQRGSDERLGLLLDGGIAVTIDPQELLAIDTATSPAPGDKAPESAAAGDESQDAVTITKDGERLTLRGTVTAVTRDGVEFAWRKRELNLPWSGLVNVTFARKELLTPLHTVETRSGDVFAGEIVDGAPDTLALKSATLGPLAFPLQRVRRISSRSPRVVYLSELEPQRYEFQPLFGKRWGYAVDQTLRGRPIRLGGMACARGICLHSHAKITYRLDGEFERFVARVGILDETDGKGNVALRVIGDGRVLWQAQEVTGGEPPRDVAVTVSGVAELTLEVGFGEELDLADHVCWAAARLIRPGQRGARPVGP